MVSVVSVCARAEADGLAKLSWSSFLPLSPSQPLDLTAYISHSVSNPLPTSAAQTASSGESNAKGCGWIDAEMGASMLETWKEPSCRLFAAA